MANVHGVVELRKSGARPMTDFVYQLKPESWLANMIYRIITDFRMIQFESDPKQKELVWQFVLPATREDQKMTGAGTCFGNIMFMHGLPAPLIQNPRARFYFTEKGWNKVGRFVTCEAQKKGFVMKVIRRKNPAASQIVYRDGLQVSLLPNAPLPAEP